MRVFGITEQLRSGPRRVEVVAGVEDLVVDIDPQSRIAQAARRVDQRIEYGKRIHVGAQTFHVDTDDEIRCPLPGAPYPAGASTWGCG